MKIKELCKTERPREKMLRMGPGSLSEGELLSILLRNGTRDSSAVELSNSLLRSAQGTLSNLFEMTVTQLTTFKGIKSSKACSIMAAFELGKRWLEEKSAVVKSPVFGPRIVFDLMLPLLKGKKHEECWVIMLNGASYVIGKEKVSSGGGHATTFDVQQIARKALEKNSCSVILVHNHPSGNPRPSAADIKSTDELRTALKCLKISLSDHVVVCDDCFFSFADDRLYFQT